LQECYRDEYVSALTQAFELYAVYHEKIKIGDEKIEKQRVASENCEREISISQKHKIKPKKNVLIFDVSSYLIRITGIDLTAMSAIEAGSALKIISEIGFDLSRWKSAKKFASWLGLCPGNKISGGKKLSSKSKRKSNYTATAFRLAANTLYRSQTSLGAFLRKLKSRMGAPKAITATAHKSTIIMYNMLTRSTAYVETGIEYYEKQYLDRTDKEFRATHKRARMPSYTTR